jgi:L-amino acid N-acyltransferase YncA
MAKIRLATADDAAQIAAIYAPYVNSAATSFEIEAPGSDEMRRRIITALERWVWLVCDADGVVVGYAYGSKHRERAAYNWSVDVSVYNHESAHRRGVGRALYTSLLRLLSAQGYYTAYAGITLPNAASVGLHEAMGFTPVGVYRSVGYKLGGWHDVGWWALALRERRGEPSEAVSLDAIRGTAAFDEALAAGPQHLRL